MQEWETPPPASLSPDDARVRIGSNTKAFVSTVVMQLVDDGLLDLDMSIEHYLPGTVVGNGNDGNRVTIRDLLQHTSGLTDYLAAGGARPEDIKPGQLLVGGTSAQPPEHFSPTELVDIAMSLPPGPAAKDKAVYSNTNYILLGMLIEKVTGRPAAQEITTRIIDPLGLMDTYFPASRETQIRGSHAQAITRLTAFRSMSPMATCRGPTPQVRWSQRAPTSTLSSRLCYAAISSRMTGSPR